MRGSHHLALAHIRSIIGEERFTYILEAMAALHHCNTDTALTLLCYSSSVDRPGSVMCLDGALINAATLYSTLTGRAAPTVVGHGQAPEPPEIVIGLLSSMSDSLLRGLIAADSSIVPGLILGSSLRALHEAVFKYSLALACSDQIRANRVNLLYSDMIFDPIDSESLGIMSGGAGSGNITKAMYEHAPITAIFSHGKYFELKLGPDLFACPYGLDIEMEDGLRPPCLVSGHCTQLTESPSRERAWSSAKLINFSQISTGALVLGSCSSIYLERCFTFYKSSPVATALNRDAIFGACALTWKYMGTSEGGDFLNSLINDLAFGLPIGNAVRAFNQSPISKLLGNSLCIFGDSQYKLCPSESFKQLPQPAMPSVNHRLSNYTTSDNASEIEMRKNIVRILGHNSSRLHLSRHEINLTIDALSLSFYDTGHSESHVRRLWQESNSQTSQLLSSSFITSELDAGFREYQDYDASYICGTCGNTAYAYNYITHPSSANAWLLMECASCGSYKAGPIAAPNVLLQCHENSWILTLDSYLADTRAAIHIFQAGYSRSTRHLDRLESFIVWPLDETGQIAKQMVIPIPAGGGPLKCHVSFAWSVGHSIYELCLFRCGSGDN